MKIIVTGTRGIPDILGGVETHCEQLFPIIAENEKFKITIVRRSSYIISSNKIKQYKCIILVDIFSPRTKSFEAIIHTFLSIIYARFKNAQIVHIHAIGPAILTPFARLLGLKVVFTHHGADYNRQKWGKLAKWILKTGERFGIKYSNRIIVISNGIKRDIEKMYNAKNVFLIPNGVVIPEKSKSIDYIESLGLSPRKYIIAVGRFVPEKGFHDLINAYSKITTEYKLVLVGDADHESEYSIGIKQKAIQHNIVLTGFIKGEKLNQIFSNAAIFVMPSYHEGLPIALLEAMSYNLSILVSDIEPNKEIELGSQNYFKLGDEKDLILKLINKLSSSDINDFTSILNKKYNWRKIAQMTAEVYEMM